MFDSSNWLRPHLAELPPYTPIEPFEVLSERLGRRPEDIHKLDANENPYGAPPAVRRAIAELPYPHIYPDPESRALRRALAQFTGLPMANILAGAGADELIDLIMRVGLSPGDCLVDCPPTFSMYAFDAEMNAGRVISVPRRADFSVDVEAIYTAVEIHQPKLLCLTSPNNPDGSLIDNASLEALLHLPLLVVLDEAYIEFAAPQSLGGSLTRLGGVLEHDNLVVLRTFSKWAGLAGLRVGYGAFPDWLIPTLWKAKQPYNVNTAASYGAIAALDHAAELSLSIARLSAERQRLYAGLEAIPWLRPYPSQANFILCRVEGYSAADLKTFLAQQHGILVRYFNKPGLSDHIRISIGRPESTSALLQALNDYPQYARSIPEAA